VGFDVGDGTAFPAAGEVGDVGEVDRGVAVDGAVGWVDLLALKGAVEGGGVDVDEVDFGVDVEHPVEVEVIAVAGAEDADATSSAAGGWGEDEAFDVAAVGGVPVPLTSRRVVHPGLVVAEGFFGAQEHWCAGKIRLRRSRRG